MLTSAFKYKSWADLRTFDAISKVDANVHAALFDFMRQQLNHMTIVEEIFSARLTETRSAYTQTNTGVLPSIDVLQDRSFGSNTWYSEYCEAHTSAELGLPIDFVFVDGKPGCMTRGEILFHIINHGSYHRGAISHALDLTGVAHPIDGFAAFLHS